MENKPTLAVDFDGTIYDGKAILPGCLEKLEALRLRYRIAIYSARQTEHERDEMLRILDSNSVPYDDILAVKEMYDILLDDKAVRFEAWDKVKI
jgi:ribonucleotide monophosphatase NagD (HAD superfamily)